MAKELKLQDPGEGIHEVEIQEVLVSEGDQVEEGQSVLVVESDKAAVELPAPYSGTVSEIRVSAGDMAEVGDVLMTFDEEGAEAAPAREKETEEPEAREEAEEEEPAEAAEEEPEHAKEEEREAEPAPEREPEPEKEKAPERKGKGPVPASPATRRLARELGVDLAEVEPSGAEGRVLDEDVRAAAGEAEPERAKERAPRRAAPAEAPELPDFAQWGEVERQPLRSIRRETARQMAVAWSRIPHVTHMDVADVSELETFRRRHAERVEAQGGKLTMTVFALKAAVAALKEQPRFNASFDPEAEEIVLKHYFHIGIAVETEQGLLVPVIRDVDRKSVDELAIEAFELAERTRAGKARRGEMAGGTFTITNVGPLGGTAFTPIINHPEVAILGLARERLEPVVEGSLDDFVVRPRLRLPLCLAFDHRIVDGAEAARFTRRIAEILADPEALTLSA